jgi:hypothetical protein
MQNIFEETRQQLHEFRILLGHLKLEVRDLETQMAEIRISMEHRIDRIELALNLLPRPAHKESLAAHEDKESPEILPPQKPAS